MNVEYNPNDYQVTKEDIFALDNERPVGLTGHLRAYNEGLTLRLCIESCIPFLDELNITYNDSIDDTESIIMEMYQKYPNRIKVFHYKPFLVPSSYISDVIWKKSRGGVELIMCIEEIVCLSIILLRIIIMDWYVLLINII